MTAFKINRYETVAEIETLETAWEKLHNRCSNPSIYNSFDFMFESIRTFPLDGAKLEIFSVEDVDNNKIIAIFPFQTYLGKWHFLQVQRYDYVGLEEGDKPYAIIDKDFVDKAWNAIIGHLNNTYKDWDRLCLTEFPVKCVESSLISNICRKNNLNLKETEDSSGPVIYFSGSWEEYWSQHKKMRKKVTKMEKDFGEKLAFTVHTTNTEHCLKQYCELEQKSWKKGKVGISKNDNTRKFYQRLISRLENRGQVYFGFLTIDGELASAEIAYALNDTLYFSHGCYDNEYQKYSPGMVSTSYFLKYFYSMEFKTGDFLCGYAGYLDAWSDQIIKTKTIEIVNNNFKMNLITFTQKFKQSLRPVKKLVSDGIKSSKPVNN